MYPRERGERLVTTHPGCSPPKLGVQYNQNVLLHAIVLKVMANDRRTICHDEFRGHRSRDISNNNDGC
ncbi:hypothetical protein TNCV_4022751 [Trichonephila clavipes]|nr:hypothetical protein TNCV_4022751 [Trichonephila clavipes]